MKATKKKHKQKQIKTPTENTHEKAHENMTETRKKNT